MKHSQCVKIMNCCWWSLQFKDEKLIKTDFSIYIFSELQK